MKNFIITILICSYLTTYAQHEDILNEMTQEKHCTGISAGYMINGEVAWINSSGYMNQAADIPANDSTLYRTASIAKGMTAIAIIQLMEANLLKLDDPISMYISDLPQDKKGITIHQLLSHTSGIGSYKSSKETESTKEYKNLPEASKVFIKRKLKFVPGTNFTYSTYGYVLLGMVIESVSSQSYEDYIHEHILIPAGMTNTGIEKYGTTYSNKSQLYHRHKKKNRIGKVNNLSNRIPGGGFYSTVGDLLKYGNAIINNELINPESLELMSTVHSIKKEGNPYGYGWYLYGGPPAPGRVFGHSGEQTGTATQIMIAPSIKSVVVVMSNTSGTWNDVINLSIEILNSIPK